MMNTLMDVYFHTAGGVSAELISRKGTAESDVNAYLCEQRNKETES